MASVTVLYRDGTKEFLEDRGAAGGSYCQSVSYEEGFAIIESAHGDKRAIPVDLIKEIQIHSGRRGW